MLAFDFLIGSNTFNEMLGFQVGIYIIILWMLFRVCVEKI